MIARVADGDPGFLFIFSREKPAVSRGLCLQSETLTESAFSLIKIQVVFNPDIHHRFYIMQVMKPILFSEASTRAELN